MKIAKNVFVFAENQGKAYKNLVYTIEIRIHRDICLHYRDKNAQRYMFTLQRQECIKMYVYTIEIRIHKDVQLHYSAGVRICRDTCLHYRGKNLQRCMFTIQR